MTKIANCELVVHSLPRETWSCTFMGNWDVTWYKQ